MEAIPKLATFNVRSDDAHVRHVELAVRAVHAKFVVRGVGDVRGTTMRGAARRVVLAVNCCCGGEYTVRFEAFTVSVKTAPTWLRSLRDGRYGPSYVPSSISRHVTDLSSRFSSFLVERGPTCFQHRRLNVRDVEIVAHHIRSEQEQHGCAEESSVGHGSEPSCDQVGKTISRFLGMCVEVERNLFTVT